MDSLFILNSILLGVGLAMDAFSLSVADALHEPDMRRSKRCLISFTFAAFQFLMPLTGWFLVHTLVTQFRAFEPFIPWIALILLSFIGGKMLLEAIRGEEEQSVRTLTAGAVLVQGIATSIDALSVGFTIASYNALSAVICALLIGVTTFIITSFGFMLGSRAAGWLGSKAGILGGLILIGIGLEIFIRGVFF